MADTLCKKKSGGDGGLFRVESRLSYQKYRYTQQKKRKIPEKEREKKPNNREISHFSHRERCLSIPCIFSLYIKYNLQSMSWNGQHKAPKKEREIEWNIIFVTWNFTIYWNLSPGRWECFGITVTSPIFVYTHILESYLGIHNPYSKFF